MITRRDMLSIIPGIATGAAAGACFGAGLTCAAKQIKPRLQADEPSLQDLIKEYVKDGGVGVCKQIMAGFNARFRELLAEAGMSYGSEHDIDVERHVISRVCTPRTTLDVWGRYAGASSEVLVNDYVPFVVPWSVGVGPCPFNGTGDGIYCHDKLLEIYNLAMRNLCEKLSKVKPEFVLDGDIYLAREGYMIKVMTWSTYAKLKDA